jgi:DNA-directed RNA polymerase subunit L
MIEKISNVLRVEPYFFFKNPKVNNDILHDEKLLPRLPYKIKKQIQTHIKSQIKTQIRTQIKAQVNLSLNEILDEINEILDKY